MIVLAAAIAMHCAPSVVGIPTTKPRPIYTRAQRLKDSFDALAKQPNSASFLRSQTIYQKLNFGPHLP